MLKALKAFYNNPRPLPEYSILLLFPVVLIVFSVFNIAAANGARANVPKILSLTPGDQVGQTEYLGVQGQFLEWAQSGSGLVGFSSVTLLPDHAGAQVKIDGNVYQLTKTDLATGKVWLSRRP